MALVKPVLPRVRQGHALAKGLIGAWLMRSGAGSLVNDASGQGNVGRMYRAGLLYDGAWRAGPFGPALIFDMSAPDYLDLGRPQQLTISGAFSIAAWCMLASAGLSDQQFRTIVEKGYDGTREPYYLRTNGSGGTNFAFQFGGYDSSTIGDYRVSGNPIYSPADYGRWFHVVGTFSGSVYSIYVNGILDNAAGSTNAPVDAVTPVTIGNSSISGAYNRGWDGQIDSVLFYNRAITASEVGALYGDQYAAFRRRWFPLKTITSVIVRPDVDDSNSGWTTQGGGTTNLYLTIDETAPPNDADYIWSSANPTSDVVRFRISDPTAAMAEPFKVRYRYGSVGVGSCTITVRLKQGVTTIKTWVHTDATATLQTVTQTLSAGEYASITDFNNLFVEFEAGP